MTRLSKVQKANLAQLARRAFEHIGRTAAEPLPDFDTWRREQVFAACRKPGLTRCDQGDFNLVASHFHSLLGEDGIAMNELVRANGEWRRQAEAVLLRELASVGFNQAYAESISRSRFGVNVGDTTDAQFKMLLMTIRSRVRARRQKRTEVPEELSYAQR